MLIMMIPQLIIKYFGVFKKKKKNQTHFLLFLHLLPPFLFLLHPTPGFSNFWDLLPLLLQFFWPWNQPLMGAQWPRAEPTCCIQMWPHAIITAFPALNKHSFNRLSSHALMNFYISWRTFLNSHLIPAKHSRSYVSNFHFKGFMGGSFFLFARLDGWD